MPATAKASEIGLRQARQLCAMPAEKQLAFIAEGLPIILESAQSLMRASRTLPDFPREAELLERHAEEECAKILILVDIARCPPRLTASRMGPMVKWFYDHLARLIYAAAQTWKPVSVAQLQEYVDNERKSHYLEGEYSEFIIPNWTLFSRESSLYADVVGNEDAEPSWISPLLQTVETSFASLDPVSYRASEALAAFGVFTLPGLKIVRDVWGKVNFDGSCEWGISRELCHQMAKKLEAATLITEEATEDHLRVLYQNWQIPMYHIDFSEIPVSIDDLKKHREMNSPWEW
jgi:hypothetical protein